MIALRGEFDLRYLDAVEIRPARKEPSALQLKLDAMSRRVRDAVDPVVSFVQMADLEVRMGAQLLKENIQESINQGLDYVADPAANLALSLPAFGYAAIAVLAGVIGAEAAQIPHGAFAEAAALASSVLISSKLAQEIFRESNTTSLPAWRKRD